MFLVIGRELREVESIDNGVVNLWQVVVGGQIQSSTVVRPTDKEVEKIAKMYDESQKPTRQQPK